MRILFSFETIFAAINSSERILILRSGHISSYIQKGAFYTPNFSICGLLGTVILFLLLSQSINDVGRCVRIYFQNINWHHQSIYNAFQRLAVNSARSADTFLPERCYNIYVSFILYKHSWEIRTINIFYAAKKHMLPTR